MPENSRQARAPMSPTISARVPAWPIPPWARAWVWAEAWAAVAVWAAAEVAAAVWAWEEDPAGAWEWAEDRVPAREEEINDGKDRQGAVYRVQCMH
ncbi:hypothetical protein SCFA_1550010 [anaerobic digester metagenome]|uniref:Uncharacterized protein n=1 Tax=anaerobic digester metagenome TaxID=1263854 RepID=A0A485LWT9_9ZZZZ